MEKLFSALGRFFNSAMLVAAVLACILTAAIVVGEINKYFSVTLPTKQVKVAEFVVRHKACSDPQYPLYVKFKNESDRTVLAINFSFEAYIRGRSTDIAEYNSLRDDTILKPGEAYSSCWSRPKLDAAPIYGVSASDGKRFIVTAPKEATDADVISFVKQKHYGATYFVLPDGGWIEFAPNTDRKTMNRVLAEEHRNQAQPKGWDGYEAKARHKPVAINEKTKEVYILSDEGNWIAAQRRIDAQSGKQQFFDGDRWRPSPFRTQQKSRFGGIPVPEDEDISFVITDNVDYKLRKTSVEFQD
jgi:hypothetical protein